MKIDLHITPEAQAVLGETLDTAVRNAAAAGLELRLHTAPSPPAPSDTRLSAVLVLTSEESCAMTAPTKTPIIVLADGPYRKEDGCYILPKPDKAKDGLWPDLFLAACQAALMRRLYHDALRQVEAFEASSELSRKELMELKRAFMAQEAALEFSRQERLEYEREIRARDQVSEFGRKELMDSRNVLEAWDRFYLFVVEELKALHNEIEAQERTIELSGEELRRSDQTLKALDNLVEKHRLDAIRELEGIDRLSEQEIASLLEEEGVWKALERSTDRHQLVLVIRALFKVLLRRLRKSATG